MITGHPTDTQLQEYALDREESAPGLMEHIDACVACQAAVADYQRLFIAIHEQPEPAFDFDFADLALSTWPEQRRKQSLFPFVLATLLVAAPAVPVYLFKDNMVNLFNGISPFFLYGSIGAALIFVGIQVMGVIKKSDRQLKIVSHSS